MTLRPLVVAILLVPALAYTASQDPESRRAAATFVFLGTVASSPGAGSPGAAAPGVLVVVNEIIFQKGTFENQTGRQVEVVGAPSTVKEKAQYVFYTDPVRFGDRVVVNVIDVSAAGAPPAGQPAAAMKQQVAEASERRAIQERATLAELVLSGVVTDIRPLESAVARDTEHAPDFRVARLKPERALKGKPPGEVEFVFANSKDVQWFQAPKFRNGDRGIFFLQRPSQDAARMGVSSTRYTVLHPLDFRPARDLQAVEAALKAVKP